jgi:uncharacterized protein (TIGR00369 family)
MRLTDDKRCFVCGDQNPQGLRLTFHSGDGQASATFTPGLCHGGYAEMAHGGVLAAVLDEAMVYAAMTLGSWVATAELTVRFRRPATIGAALTVTARVVRSAGRLVECEAELRTTTGEEVASARGKMMKEAVDPDAS